MGENKMTPEQAQTVAEIRERHKYASKYAALVASGKDAHEDRAALLQIIDSQAAEIAAKAKTIETNAKYAISIQGELMAAKVEVERLNTENNARSLALDAARSEIERLTKECGTLSERLRHANDALTSIGIEGY
jgi:predicted  nucleic acid-binding Zn-ribbon protein